MAIEVKVPALGESVTEATVGAWFKSPGDMVADGEIICELETDKVNLDVPSPVAGQLTKQLVSEGDTVEPDALLALIETKDITSVAPQKDNVTAGPSSKPGIFLNSPAAPSAEDGPPAETPPKPKMSRAPLVAETPQKAPPMAGPAARKTLSEKGVSPTAISGSGRQGRVTKADALAVAPPVAAPVAATAAMTESHSDERETRVPMTRLRQTIARRLKQAQETAAMLTTFNEVDMTSMREFRSTYRDEFERRHGSRLGFMAFFVSACVRALQEYPAVNAEIDGNEIVYKNHYDIGVAVGTPDGLVVPVIRDCDQIGFAGIEKALAKLAARAREGTLAISDLQGGTFTISNGGVYGSLMSTPIINPPQSAILGMHKIQKRPVEMNDEIIIRPMMYLALSYDHRIIDGREAVSFLVRIKEAVEDPRRLLLDL